jgi:putative ABC transport system ATP-binding protein
MPKPESGTILEAINLSRTYPIGRQPVAALDDVGLSIRKGEFAAIMGPSGSGKSTLLNLLGGLDQPTRGKVLLDGHDLSEYNEQQLAALRRKMIGFIFQRHDLFPVLTARENIEFPMLFNGMTVEERRSRSEELLALVSLEDKASALPEELSGGQQQRIGIARALANMPSILLADEPTGNLDSLTSEEIIKALIAIREERGLTLIMVTHDPEVAAHANRIIQLEDGHLLARTGIDL